jgi:hypothetical protein
VPLFPRSKKKTNDFGFTSGMNIMRRFLNAILNTFLSSQQCFSLAVEIARIGGGQ